MVRHTLIDAGAELLATRMVREYVERLYVAGRRLRGGLMADGYAARRRARRRGRRG